MISLRRVFFEKCKCWCYITVYLKLALYSSKCSVAKQLSINQSINQSSLIQATRPIEQITKKYTLHTYIHTHTHKELTQTEKELPSKRYTKFIYSMNQSITT